MNKKMLPSKDMVKKVNRPVQPAPRPQAPVKGRPKPVAYKKGGLVKKGK